MKNRFFPAILFASLIAAQVVAQSRPDLNELGEKVNRHIETKMPGWKHKRVEPFMNSPNVFIEVWSFPTKGATVQIVPYKSRQEAREVLRSFLKYEKEKEEIKGLGDEAYVWGIRRANVVFTRGKFIVYVEAGVDIEADPEARKLSGPEMFERQRTAAKQLSKDFAKLLVDAIDLP